MSVSLKKNLKKIKFKKSNIAVIGLGYIGLPLLVLFLKNKFNVIGIDKDKKKIIKLKKNISYISGVSNNILKNFLEIQLLISSIIRSLIVMLLLFVYQLH